MNTRIKRIQEDINHLSVTEYQQLLEELALVPNNINQHAEAIKVYQMQQLRDNGLTLREVANILKISYATAKNYVKDGYIQPMKGKSKRFSYDTVANFDKKEMQRERRNRRTSSQIAGKRNT